MDNRLFGLNLSILKIKSTHLL